MAMGKRRQDEQATFWVPTAQLPQSGGHPFYERLNRILDGEGFDRFVEARCREFYADKMGRPSLPPAIYFRMLLIGYFEGIDLERSWRSPAGSKHRPARTWPGSTKNASIKAPTGTERIRSIRTRRSPK